jgi:hypothetical protein
MIAELLADKLKQYPEIASSVAKIVDIAEDTNNINKADDVEEMTHSLVQALGRDTIQAWATSKNQKTIETTMDATPEYRKHVKKNFSGIQRMERWRS